MPMPKKIPGHLVVWIDNSIDINFNQNLQHYLEIVKELNKNNINIDPNKNLHQYLQTIK